MDDVGYHIRKPPILKPQNRQKSGKYDEICMTCHWTDLLETLFGILFSIGLGICYIRRKITEMMMMMMVVMMMMMKNKYV